MNKESPESIARHRTHGSGFFAGLVVAIAGELSSERDRWALWVPVGFGFGIAIYFAVPFEPNLNLLLTALAAAVTMVVVFEYLRLGWVATTAIIVSLILAGVVLIAYRSAVVAAPRVQGSVTLNDLTGTVISVEAFSDGPRVRLDRLDASNGWRMVDGFPESVRIRLRRDANLPEVGQRIVVTARLSEPPRPSFPRAYDFARAAWFQSLGGVGFAFSEWRPIQTVPAEDSLSRRFEFAVARIRHRVSLQIRESLPGEPGTVAAALLSGDRAPVAESVLDNLRRSGLAHLLAISGLHVGMVALIVFVSLRTLFALHSRWTRNRPIKKWAAGAALVATFGYMLLAGATVPTQRAFLMTGVVLIAVILDRQAISMRLVAIAAMVVLLVQPESVAGASFQMSFAAVVALVAFYETIPVAALRRDGGQGNGGRLSRAVWYVAAVCLTTLIAGTATAPFSIHHFGQVAHYSVLANLVAVPIVTFWVMPLGLLSLIAMPVGLHDLPLYLCGYGIEAVLAIARFVAGLPGAVGLFPALTDWGFMFVIMGGLWTAIWRRRWRFFGLLPIVVGLLSGPVQSFPALILHENGDQAAILWGNGYWVESTRRERFSLDVWEQRTGLAILGNLRALSEQRNAPIRCGPLGCIITLSGEDAGGERPFRIALTFEPRALRADCPLADVTRSPIEPHPGICQDRLVIGPADLARHGAHSITIGPDGPILERVEDRRGHRPWSRRGP